jgi:hypothetical protein
MDKLTPRDLYTLEDYARHRAEFRARVMEHKQHRRLQLGPHLTLCFEDRLTMQYQVQEMLRAERIFEESEIRGELEAYNPLIPDGSNWKATLLIEYPDPAERRAALEKLVGIERAVWIRVASLPPVRAIADEDLERATETKTSAVHFLRFELTPAMIGSLKDGAAVAAGVDHPAYAYRLDNVPEVLRESLIADLD